MPNDTEPTLSGAGDDPAALAFEALRVEVALARRAIADLAAEHAGSVPPDYSETLGNILRASSATAASLKGLAEAPALRLGAQGWARELAAAGEEARRADQEMLSRARDDLQRAAHDLTTNLQSAKLAESQRRWLRGTATGGVLAGMLLLSIMVGPFVRAMPESWHWPERVAAQIIGLNPEAAGVRLIITAAPQRWRDIVLGYRIVNRNREAIARCAKAQANGVRSVRCVINIDE